MMIITVNFLEYYENKLKKIMKKTTILKNKKKLINTND